MSGDKFAAAVYLAVAALCALADYAWLAIGFGVCAGAYLDRVAHGAWKDRAP